MRLVKSILGCTLKTKFFEQRIYNENCKNFYLKLVLKNQMAEFFEKKNKKKTKQEKPNFDPFMQKSKSSPKTELHKFLQIKNS